MTHDSWLTHHWDLADSDSDSDSMLLSWSWIMNQLITHHGINDVTRFTWVHRFQSNGHKRNVSNEMKNGCRCQLANSNCYNCCCCSLFTTSPRTKCQGPSRTISHHHQLTRFKESLNHQEPHGLMSLHCPVTFQLFHSLRFDFRHVTCAFAW
jgi:hypothetical protein